ncbi:aminoglycoside adenylyltransferase [Micromonospora sp. NPDC049559]|uniref:nucleotidyltransferase domain-containing protein n=1 Tax=Micromonospora sp. NPDC049559 TaxID=3155923 RepID=UPI00341A3CBC
MDTERAERQLRLIAEVVRLAGELNVRVWLRGGWAMDFFLGEVTRDHVDVDWFAWAHDAAVLRAALLRHGYRPLDGPPPEQQLDLVKEGEELSFAWLAEDGPGRVVVGGGPWAGQPWPAGMLDGTTGRIGRQVCPVVSPAAQIEIKRMMPVWVPGRPRREKDAADIARLERALGPSRTASGRVPG